MYENMTVLPNNEYAELVIKAHKYEQLREQVIKSTSYVCSSDIIIFELTENELKAIEARRTAE